MSAGPTKRAEEVLSPCFMEGEQDSPGSSPNPSSALTAAGRKWACGGQAPGAGVPEPGVGSRRSRSPSLKPGPVGGGALVTVDGSALTLL